MGFRRSPSLREAVRRIGLAAAALGTLVLAAAPATAEPALKPFKIAVPGESLDFGHWYLAKEFGFFTKNGVDASFVFLAPPAVPGALVGNSVQATPMTGTTMHGKFAGFAVRTNAIWGDKPLFEVVAKDSIHSIADLRGKVVVTSSPNATPAATLRYILAENHLVPGKDVKLVYMGAVAARMTLMQAGQADAIIDSMKTTFELMDKTEGLHVLVSHHDMPRQLIDGMGTSENLIEHDPDLIKAVIRSVLQGLDYAQAHPDEAGKVLAKYLKLGPAEGRKAADALLDSLCERPAPTEDLFAAEAHFETVSSGHPVSVDKIKSAWNTALAAEVAKEMAKH
jgi:ABC-type nitrate/sulfonate/bicarbonate transport system substrate-binding protein